MALTIQEDEDLKDFYRILKASSLAQASAKEKDPDKAAKMERQQRRLKSKLNREDALSDLYELFDAEMMSRMDKPQLQEPSNANLGTPQQGSVEHPVTQQRKQVDQLMKGGSDPLSAHQEVHGDINTGDIQSKAKLAGTLGRIQQDGTNNDIKYDKNPENFKSILAVDAEIEKQIDQVTRNDLRTPQDKQVPDSEQVPAQQQAEEVSMTEEIDYHEFDVMYLKTFGRA